MTEAATLRKNEAATFQLDMTRFIRAPRDKVFDAFISEAALSSWYCPRGMHISELTVEPRVGGAYRLAMSGRDGSAFVVTGKYQALDRPGFLAYTWLWESGVPMAGLETLIEVTLTERDGGTLLHMRHTGFPDAGLRDGHADGWNSVFNRLVDHLDPERCAANITVMGDPRSSYCRTVRIALAEKGVAYKLEPCAPHTPEINAVHPFGRVPALRDGPFELFETRAIMGYIDDAFDGPSLLPTGGAYARARGEQWMSAITCYGYDVMVRRYVLQYVFPRGADGQPDRAVIEAALPEIRHFLGLLDKAYSGRDYLVGRAPSMVDFLLAPVLWYVGKFPEGAELLAQHANVQRAQAIMQARPSFIATQP